MGDQEQPVAAPLRPLPDKERRWLPTLAVLGVLLFVPLGGFVFIGDPSAAVTDVAADPLPPVVVAGRVAVHPLPGWLEAERFEQPDGVRLTKGSSTLDVFVLTYIGTPQDLFDEYVVEVLEAQGSRVRVSPQVDAVTLDSGLTAIRGSYIGFFGNQAGSIEGELTTVVSPEGTGVVFDGWASEGLYGFAAAEVRRMVQTVEIS